MPEPGNPDQGESGKRLRKSLSRDPRIEVIHAGLECGVIGDKYEGRDMISFGPTIVNAHSPDEAVSISSVQAFWKLLLALLEKCAKKSDTKQKQGWN